MSTLLTGYLKGVYKLFLGKELIGNELYLFKQYISVSHIVGGNVSVLTTRTLAFTFLPL